jgi:CelD/BcsL family acetyltransferase involved in cellulose biosynthesis
MRIETLSAFAQVGAERWNALLDRAALPTVFLTWQWQTTWARAFDRERALRLLAARDEGEGIVGLLPLYEEPSPAGAPPRLKPIGGEDVSDYLDLIAPAGLEEAVWDALLRHRAEGPGTWELRGIRAASPTLGLVPRLGAARGLRVEVAREERCPVLELPGTWDAYLARLPGKDRHELKRKMRRIERELPGVKVRMQAEPPGWDAAMGEFVVLHRASKVGKAGFMDLRMEGFFRSVMSECVRAGWARLWFLDHAGAPLAAYLCLEFGGSVGLYNSGFDPERARLAPGIVLLAHVIRDAIERGERRFDFLRGEEGYKHDLGGVSQDLFAIRVTA